MPGTENVGVQLQLQKEHLPSFDEIREPEVPQVILLQRWQSLNEYVAFCIGKHSGLIAYMHCRHINPAIDLLFYFILGIPICYLQLVLGQYTNLGVFLVRYIQPLAQGISYVSLIITFFLAVINMSEIKCYLIYIMLASDPTTTVWNLCPPEHEDICWNYFVQNCTLEKPCMNETIKLPTYLFWNFTFLGGALPEEEAHFSKPEADLVWVTLVTWLPIFCLLILKFTTIKKFIQIVVGIAMVMDVAFLLKLGSYIGFSRFIARLLYIEPTDWIQIKNWTHSMERLFACTLLGDFAYVMFGSCTTYSAHTDSMAFIGILLQYVVYRIQRDIVLGCELVLAIHAKIPLDQVQLFRERRAPDSLTVVPAAFDLINKAGFWTILYFINLIITHLTWACINFTFILVSIYQRFPATISYTKYLCSLVCIFGFFFELFFYTKEVFAIRVDLILLMLNFCQYVIVWFFCVMAIYFYGIRRLGNDIQFMSGKQPASFWKITWLSAPPIMCVGFAYNMLEDPYHPLFGYRITFATLVLSPIAFFMITVICKRVYRRNILGIFAVHEFWGPMDPVLHRLRKEFFPRRQTIYKRYDQKCQHLCLLHHKTFEKVIAEEADYENSLNETERNSVLEEVELHNR